MVDELEVGRNDLTALAAAAIALEDTGDIAAATSLYKIGVSLGDTTCMNRLADLFSEPPKFPNVKLAEALYQRSCIAGDPIGCSNLAVLYKQLGKFHLHDRYMRLAKVRGDDWEDEV